MASDVIDQELDAVRAVGARVERLVGVPFAGCEKRHALRYPGQATFHPLKYLAGVAEACMKRGARFHADTPVEEVLEENGAVTVKTACGIIVAAHAVVATNSPIADRFALHTKMAPYRTYVIGFAIDRGTLPDALYCDTEEPYHYVRLQPGDGDQEFVLVGGEDHKSGKSDDADERFARLEKWSRRLMPRLGNVTHRWSGQVLDTIDYAGFIGKNPGNEHIYVSTGDSGQGLTHGVMGAMLNSALIAGGEGKWGRTLRPAASRSRPPEATSRKTQP